MSWLSTFIDNNRNVAGDAIKYGSDLAAPFTGPFAPLVAGLGNAAGTALHKGTNVGDIAGSGVTGAAIGGAEYGLGKAFGAGSGAAAGSSPASYVPGPDGGWVAKGIANNVPKDLAGSAWSAVKDVGSWAGKHPEAVGQGLTALSQAPVNAAQARRMALLNQQDEYTLARQKARDQALNPIWQALAGQAQGYLNKPRTIAPNPYTGR